MRIRILGAGWYGCHLAVSLLEDGHDVEIHERADRIFAGASGRIPARLHQGQHYPRSFATREACQRHSANFMERYGNLTRGVPVNLYAVASQDSFVDFEQYRATLRGEIEYLTVHDPHEFGLCNVDGAILTAERHIVADVARLYFDAQLGDRVSLNRETLIDEHFEGITIDCTFCANDSAGVDRYEPCLVLLLEGPTDRAVTIMDGPFPSLYPWNPDRGLCSLSSAKWTPFSKDIHRYEEARAMLDTVTSAEVDGRAACMIDSMRHFYPAIDDFTHVESMLSIRAMPRSAADTRLVDVRWIGPNAIRVRAGKIDAVLDAEREVKEMLK